MDTISTRRRPRAGDDIACSIAQESTIEFESLIVVSIIAVFAVGCQPPNTAEGPGSSSPSQAETSSHAPQKAAESSATLESADPESLSDRIPDDSRAFFLEFETGGAFYRSLPIGTRVDVVTLLPEGPVTLTPTQNAEVLGVFPHPRTGTQGATVALAVLRGEEWFLELSRDRASTSLMVRGDGDEAVTPARPYSYKNVTPAHPYSLRGLLEDLEVFHALRKKRLDDARGIQESKEGLPLSERIPEDEYAVFVRWPVPTSAVTRGDRVDLTGVYSTVPLHERESRDPPEGKLIAMDLIQAVEILDVVSDQEAEDGDSMTPGGLVVALSRKETHLLRLTEHYGRVDATLRPRGALETHPIRRETMDRYISHTQKHDPDTEVSEDDRDVIDDYFGD